MTFLLKMYRSIECKILSFFYNKLPVNKLWIIKYPNPVLEKECLEIAIPPSDTDIQISEQLVDKMLEYDGIKSHFIGVGMSANQIGISKRMMVYCPIAPSNRMPRVRNRNLVYCFNPKIVKKGKQIISDYEGCLSDPTFFQRIDRHNLIEVEYYDKAGKLIQTKLSGWEAKVFQHEIDHLSGKLCRSR